MAQTAPAPRPEAPSRARARPRRRPSRGRGRRAGADPADPRDARPARPQLLGARAGHPDARRPRRARGVPVATRSRASSTPSSALLPTLEDHACSLGPPRRLHHAAARRHLGRATSPSTSRSSSRTSPAPTSATARPARPASTASTTCIYEYREEQVGHRGRQDGRRASSTTSSRPTTPSVAFDFARRARAAHPARRAARLRARPPRRSSTRPSAATSRTSGSTAFSLVQLGPGRPPAAHPGDDDLADQRRSASTSRPTRG